MRHKWKIFYLLLIIMALVVLNVVFKLFAFHPFAAREIGDFKVFCLNVHSTGEGFDERSIRIDSLIKAENPDFVFLTEYQDTCSMVLDSLLRERYEYCQRGFHGQYKLTECVYSKWSIDSISNLRININDLDVIDYLENNQYAKRHVGLSAIFRWEINCGGLQVVIYSCHLASNNYTTEIDSSRYSWPSPLRNYEQRLLAYKDGSKLREFEVEAISQRLKEEKFPVIVMGDLNDFSFSRNLEKLNCMELQDAWWEKGFGLGNTFREGLIGVRIDYILHNTQISTCDIRVLDEELSDHNALVASFKFQ